MRAAVLETTGAPLKIVNDLELPPLQDGQLLVKVSYSGVCQSQLHEVRGNRGEDRFLPHLLGHEATGWVEAVGGSVTKFQVGDPVVLGWIKGEGINVPGTRYRWRNEWVNSGGVTTFSDFTVVSENRCVRLPDSIPMDEGVLLGCAVPTGAGMLLNQVEPQKSMDLALFGLGGIGLCALMGAAAFDWKRVIAVDVSEDKLKVAKELGATHVVRADKEDPVSSIMEITSGRGVDYAVESAGLTQTIEQAFLSTHPSNGVCLFASHPKNGEKIQLDPHHLISGRKIFGSWGGGCLPDRDIPRFAELYENGKLPLHRLISKSYELEEVNEALEDLEARRVFRPLLKLAGDLRSRVGGAS